MFGILAIATILGGLAALWFFWDKIIAWRSPPSALPQSSSEPTERLVDFNYLKNSGLQAVLEAEGYRWYWSRKEKLATRIELEGWEYVEVDGERLTTGDVVLIKKKR